MVITIKEMFQCVINVVGMKYNYLINFIYLDLTT